MTRKFLNIYSTQGKLKEVVRTKSSLFNKYREIFNFDESDFTISDSKIKFEVLEEVNIELFKILEQRVEPAVVSLPTNHKATPQPPRFSL